jgi:predicted nucleic acid-binding protein
LIAKRKKSHVMRAEKVLIDTSIWIEYFQNRSHALSKRVDEYLSRSKVCVPRVVIAELIQSSRSKKETSIIERFVEAFNIVDQNEETWIKAGHLSHQLKKEGKNVNLMDCYLAVIAKDNDCQILTVGRQFEDIREILDIHLLTLET